MLKFSVYEFRLRNAINLNEICYVLCLLFVYFYWIIWKDYTFKNLKYYIDQFSQIDATVCCWINSASLNIEILNWIVHCTTYRKFVIFEVKYCIISSGPPLPGSFKNEKIMSGNWKNRRKNENIIPILANFGTALIFNLRFLKNFYSDIIL